MLQLLFTILKILGIMILVILGIILAVLLAVLLIPIRYRGDVSFDGKPKGNVLISWFLRLLTVRVMYDGESVTALVKLLWFSVFNQTVWSPEGTADSKQDSLSETNVAAETPVADMDAANVSEEEKVKTSSAMVQHESVSGDSQKSADTMSTEVEPKSTNVESKPALGTQTDRKIRAEKEPQAEISPIPEDTKTPFIEKFAAKIQSVINTVITKIQSICNGISGKYAAVQTKIDMVRDFLGNAENQKTIRLIQKQILKLIKHILPRKMNGRVKFGFDDPATTGQILTYISPFYGVYAKSVAIEPVFDEKVMEGDLHIKGRVRVGTLIWIVVRVILNKNFRVLLKKLLKRGK